MMLPGHDAATLPPRVALDQLLIASRGPACRVATRAGEAFDFDHFRVEVARWKGAFAQAGGQHYALHFHDSYAFACALFGAWAASVCVWLPADVLPATLASLRNRVSGFAGDVPLDCGVATVTALAQPSPDGPTRLDRDAQLLTVFTSGSTAQPIAIAKRLAQLFDEVETLAACWDEAIGTAQVLATVSHQHIYGLLFRVLWPLASGRAFSATRLAFPEDIARELALGPSVLVASPAHLKRLPENLPWAATRTQLRALFSSGGPLPDSAVADCRNLLGTAPIEVYGSSETGGVAWRRRNDPDATTWQLLPGVEVRMDGGQLHVRSPHIASADGFLSADRGVLVDGGFELLGRSDRVIKLEEKRLSLVAIEAALLDNDLVDDARAVLLDEARPQLGVVIVPSAQGWSLVDAQGRRNYTERLRGVLGERVEASVRPKRWRLVWALPQNLLGKTTNAAMRALFDPRRPFARLLEHNDGNALLAVEIDPASPYFNGHFAQAAVLAGVVQLEWAIRFGRELFAMDDDFQGMQALKFQQVIRPGDAVKLTLEWNHDHRMLTFGFSSQAGPHSSGRILFRGAR